MTLFKLVPSLALCQQLKATGFPQDTALAWYPEHCDDYEAPAPASLWLDEWKRIAEGIPVVCVREEMEDHESLCAAPTAEEMEEWLMTRDFFSKRAATIQIAYRAVNDDGVDYVGRYFVTALNGGDEVIGQAEAVTRITALAALVLEMAR